MVDPNRKINRFTADDLQLLEECSEEFANRFTSIDEDFMAYVNRPSPNSPIIQQARYGNYAHSFRNRHGYNAHGYQQRMHSGYNRGYYNGDRYNRNDGRGYDRGYRNNSGRYSHTSSHNHHKRSCHSNSDDRYGGGYNDGYNPNSGRSQEFPQMLAEPFERHTQQLNIPVDDKHFVNNSKYENYSDQPQMSYKRRPQTDTSECTPIPAKQKK